jgi:hypothetical protein
MIDMLPDNVLLEIFDFYRQDPSSLLDQATLILGDPLSAWRWEKLSHVCRRWRDIIFGSPRRLELQIFCTTKTPARTSLDILPLFPIIVFVSSLFLWEGEDGLENIIAAVERHDRISQVFISGVDGPVVGRLAPKMREPYPLLTTFYLVSTDESAPPLPDGFLGGSAPLLQWFILHSISFPAFPKFILSATQIFYINLYNIPHSGYISPQEMSTCLAALPNLECLTLGFQSPLSRPLRTELSSLTRVVLPVLATLYFKGASEYLEDFLARTHIPLLSQLKLRLFLDPIFDIPRLHRFIFQREGLWLLSPAWVMFDLRRIVITLGQPSRIELEILCEERDRQLPSLTHVCGQHLPLSCVEQLSVCELRWGTLHWNDGIDSSQWLELFRPFIAVRDLYVSKQFTPFVTTALQKLTGKGPLRYYLF